MQNNSASLNFLPELNLWEARAPALVQALLQDPRLGVRPPDQPVPAHLRGRLLGDAFGNWLRMRDDPDQARAKAALVEALAALPSAVVQAQARLQAQLAFAAGWNHGIWASSVCSMAALLGLAPADMAAQQALLARMQALASGLAVTATPAQIDAADAACVTLTQALTGSSDLALLWQSYQAGAALLGQGLIALATEPARRQAGSVAAWLPELQKRPGVVLNTRRYARAAMTVGGQRLRPGDGILLHLSGSDAALGFGHGPHRCPGERLALGIAAAALELLLEVGGVQAWPTEWQVLNLSNAHIPIFKEA